MKSMYILVLCSLFMFLNVGCSRSSDIQDNTTSINNSQSEITNPAAVNCIKEGYNLTIKTNPDGSQTGYCIFPNGNECEEWKFLNGECKNE